MVATDRVPVRNHGRANLGRGLNRGAGQCRRFRVDLPQKGGEVFDMRQHRVVCFGVDVLVRPCEATEVGRIMPLFSDGARYRGWG